MNGVGKGQQTEAAEVFRDVVGAPLRSLQGSQVLPAAAP